MAQIAATAAVAAAGGGPFLGILVGAAAGFVDSRYLYPSLLGRREDARPRTLLDVAAMSTQPGAPRVWALGNGIRVPLHLMFQSDKVREDTVGGSKGGVANRIRRVFSDALFSVNDRPTFAVRQVIASGKLVAWSDRNLVRVRSHLMTVSNSSGNLLLSMQSRQEPDFADSFVVGDTVRLAQFVANGGPDINVGYWEAVAVTQHGGTPSTLELAPRTGQSLAGLAATAGDETSPAYAERADDAFVFDPLSSANAGYGHAQSGNLALFIRAATGEEVALQQRISALFGPGDVVTLSGLVSTGGAAMNNTPFRVFRIISSIGTSPGIAGVGGFSPYVRIDLTDYTGAFGTVDNVLGTSSTNRAVMRFWSGQTAVPGLFASSPLDNFHHGDEDQDEDSVLGRHKATGSIPGFDGLAYLALDQIDLSMINGNQMPLMEAIVAPDASLTWGAAIAEICARYGLAASEVDVSGVSPRLFEGQAIMGSVPGLTALQPIMVAGQIVTQERFDQLVFSEVDRLDVVQIENGAAFSDLGATSGQGTPSSGDSIRFGSTADGSLPTTVGVSFQDIDRAYGEGFESFGLRHPSGDLQPNELRLDLSQMAMLRKAARNLAATALRRQWINSETVEVQLPVAYLELIENDLVTVTDDAGNDVLARVVRREVGANWIVNVVAVREMADLAVTGSPIQRVEANPPFVRQVTEATANVLDIPPLRDEDAFQPGFYVAACRPAGGAWAGASVYVSTDGGTSFHFAASITAESGCGVTTTDLDSGPVGEAVDGTVTFDTLASVDVQMDFDGAWPIVTSDEATVQAGGSWMLVDAGGGDFEVVGFRDVVDNGGGSYTLSHLLRGLRGTHHSAEATKAAGARVTMLFLNEAVFVPLADSDVPKSLQIKVVPTGMTLSEVVAQSIDIEAWNARPMPVRDFDNVDDAGTHDRTFTFRHWSRLNLPVGSVGPFALDESAEGYRMRIYDPTGATLQRVKHRDARGTGSSTLADPSLVYTAAEQTADGYTPGATETFIVEIEQLGDVGVDTASGAAQRLGGRTWKQEI